MLQNHVMFYFLSRLTAYQVNAAHDFVPKQRDPAAAPPLLPYLNFPWFTGRLHRQEDSTEITSTRPVPTRGLARAWVPLRLRAHLWLVTRHLSTKNDRNILFLRDDRLLVNFHCHYYPKHFAPRMDIQNARCSVLKLIPTLYVKCLETIKKRDISLQKKIYDFTV